MRDSSGLLIGAGLLVLSFFTLLGAASSEPARIPLGDQADSQSNLIVRGMNPSSPVSNPLHRLDSRFNVLEVQTTEQTREDLTHAETPAGAGAAPSADDTCRRARQGIVGASAVCCVSIGPVTAGVGCAACVGAGLLSWLTVELTVCR